MHLYSVDVATIRIVLIAGDGFNSTKTNRLD